MLSLLVFAAAACVSILEIRGAATGNLDINAILDIIRTQQKIANKIDNNNLISSSDKSSEAVENESVLRSRELIRLLQQTLDDVHQRKNKERKSLNKQNNYKYQTYSNDLVNNEEDLVNNEEDDESNEENKNVNLLERFVEYLLTQSDTKQTKRLGKVNKRKLKPGTLVEPYVEEEKHVADSLSKYSRIYFILNSEAFKSSPNKKQLTDLISRLLANSSPALQNVDHSSKEVRYEGFPVRGSLSHRRSRRESAEGYGHGGRDSMEDSYKPKRPRHRNNRGDAGGRTPIPYMGHRGDIYVHD